MKDFDPKTDDVSTDQEREESKSPKPLTDLRDTENHAVLLERLQESESRLRLAIDSTQLGTWDWNRTRRTMYWSDDCKRILGIPINTHISFQEFLQCIDDADRPQIDAQVNDIINNSVDGHIDVTFRVRRFDDGRVRWIRIQGTVFSDAQKIISRFLGTMLDISDTVTANQQNALLAAIITSSNDAIIAKTVEGIITVWNDAAQHMFGYAAEEMIGQPIMKLIPPDKEEEEHFILSKLRSGESIAHYETKRVTKSGNLIDLSLTISPIKDQGGNIIGISKIARNITERKEEEKRKNDFVSIVSHELKTPLTSILLYTQLLVKKSQKAEDGSFLKMSTKIESYVKRMISMIADYLGLSRIEEGKLDMQWERFDLKPLVDEVMEEAVIIGASHRFELLGCDEVQLYADRDKMRQILINLMSNAVKYSPSGGVVVLGCAHIAGKLRVSVKDDGVGISVADQKKLFQRFYRVRNEQTKNISGFGIGLYLVSELLRLHGSEIALRSEPGKGSVFYFDLVPST